MARRQQEAHEAFNIKTVSIRAEQTKEHDPLSEIST